MQLPHQQIIPMTPEKFAELQAKYNTTEQFGTIDTHDASLTWTYNGSSDIIVTITELKSFLARHAPDSLIEEHVIDAISAA